MSLMIIAVAFITLATSWLDMAKLFANSYFGLN